MGTEAEVCYGRENYATSCSCSCFMLPTFMRKKCASWGHSVQTKTASWYREHWTFPWVWVFTNNTVMTSWPCLWSSLLIWCQLTPDLLTFISQEEVRSQDTVFVVAGVTGSVEGRELAWKFLVDNWSVLHDRYQGGFLLARLIKVTTENFVTKERAQEIEARMVSAKFDFTLMKIFLADFDTCDFAFWVLWGFFLFIRNFSRNTLHQQLIAASSKLWKILNWTGSSWTVTRMPWRLFSPLEHWQWKATGCKLQ